jgi:hypothetical protein
MDVNRSNNGNLVARLNVGLNATFEEWAIDMERTKEMR